MRELDQAHQVHPRRCACSNCRAGRTVPLDRATPTDLARMLMDLITNRTEEELQVTVHYRVPANTAVVRRDPIGVVITGADGSRWRIDAATLESSGYRRWQL
ncbi:hypothetical protein AB0L44_15075 [Nonomuraea wenchangensis]|uniref:hypothetical protein n=1 Tax=Nonomuraea wenchangensis TaxID=568860 RepID=UPI00343AFEDD